MCGCDWWWRIAKVTPFPSHRRGRWSAGEPTRGGVYFPLRKSKYNVWSYYLCPSHYSSILPLLCTQCLQSARLLSNSGVEHDLKLLNLLPPAEYWHYLDMLLPWFYSMLEIKSRALCMLGKKHSTSGIIFQPPIYFFLKIIKVNYKGYYKIIKVTCGVGPCL